MTKADALRRALTLLDELEPLVEDVAAQPYEFPLFAAEFNDAVRAARGEAFGEVPSRLDDEPPHDVTALRVLRTRLTRALGWEEQRAMKRATVTTRAKPTKRRSAR